MPEQERFNLILGRDGLQKALRFEEENIVKGYRRAVLSRFPRWGWKPILTMYRVGLIRAYLEAKKILKEAKNTHANPH